MVGDNKYASTIITLLKINIRLENWKGGWRAGKRRKPFFGLTVWICNFKVLSKANKAFILLCLGLGFYLFYFSLVNGLGYNEDTGHCGSGLVWACRLSFGLLCHFLSAHESVSSTEISFNLEVQKGCASPGAVGGSTLSFISCRMAGWWFCAPWRS